MQNRWQQSSTIWVLLAFVITLLLGACAAVKPRQTQPFTDFQETIATLKSKSDQALQQAYDQELQQFKNEVIAGDNSKVTALMLNFPPDQNFTWCYPGADADPAAASATAMSAASQPDPANSIGNACAGENKPVFAAMSDMQQTLGIMNNQLLSYATTMTALSGADDATQFDAQAEAQKFDKNATALLGTMGTLGFKTTGASSKDLALFSTLAANAANNFLEDKRRDLLAKVLAAGLTPLQNFVAKAQEAIAITGQGVKDQYMDQRMAVIRQVVTEQGDARSSALDKFMGMNTQVRQQLDLLESIYQGYGALPNAQRELIAALNQNRDVNLAELIVYATQIDQQFEALKNSAPAANSQ